jgi:hypothetical protein
MLATDIVLSNMESSEASMRVSKYLKRSRVNARKGAIAVQFGGLSGKNFKYFEVLLDGFLLRWHSHRR